MDIFSFLTIIFVSAVYGVTVYFSEKRSTEFFDKLMKKFSEKEVVTLPWQESIDHPENQLKDDDEVPLEEFDDDEFKKNVSHMFTIKSEDKEADEAQKEVN